MIFVYKLVLRNNLRIVYGLKTNQISAGTFINLPRLILFIFMIMLWRIIRVTYRRHCQMQLNLIVGGQDWNLPFLEHTHQYLHYIKLLVLLLICRRRRLTYFHHHLNLNRIRIRIFICQKGFILISKGKEFHREQPSYDGEDCLRAVLYVSGLTFNGYLKL